MRVEFGASIEVVWFRLVLREIDSCMILSAKKNRKAEHFTEKNGVVLALKCFRIHSVWIEKRIDRYIL